MLLKTILLATATLTLASAFAQMPTTPQGKIIGRVLDAKTDQPIEYATVTVLTEADSAIAGGNISTVDGRFDATVSYGKFIVRVELMSFKVQFLNALITPTVMIADLGDIKLEPILSELQGVEIEGERSQVSVQLDKKVFNVEKDLSAAGGSALDALENVPSVTVDMDGNVALRGSQAVRILIDGRPSSLTGISGSQALQNLPANSIESIEIITNPSARYEAEGMAGIINIVMKKQKKQGLNGLFSAGAGYPHNYSASVNLNYGFKKVNLFGNYGASYRSSPGNGFNHRVTAVDSTAANDSTVFDTENSFDWGGWNHNARLGADWTINDKNTLTTSGGVNIGRSNNPRKTDYKFYDAAGILEQHFDRASSVPDVNPQLNMDAAIAYKHLFKEKDHFLSADASVSKGHNEELIEITENYYIENYADANTPSVIERSSSADNTRNIVAKLDYARPLGKTGKLELGYRSGFQNIDRKYALEDYDDTTGTWVHDSTLSNHFIYDENVHAGYLIYGLKAKKMSYQAGLRLENANVTGELEETGESFKKTYTHLFPSLHISRDMGKGHKLQVSYSRRIQRPSFWNLNPFMSHSDPYNMWTGNPNLNPELTHSIELADIWYGKTSSASGTIYYRHTDSVITRIRTIDAEGVSMTFPRNLNTKDAIGIEITFGTSLFKWWKINGSVNYYREMVDGANIDTTFATDFMSYSARLMSMMDLWKGSMLQIMTNYRGPEESPQGTRKQMVFFDIGLKQDVLHGKGTLTLKAVDPFNTHRFRFTTIGTNYTIDSNFQRHARGFLLNFSYKLNNFRMRERERNSEYQMEEIGF